MRELKFRAWDTEENKMIFNPIANDLNVATAYIGLNELLNKYPKKGFELMQFTGLKDRLGKEIYEGDILGFSDGRKRKKENLEIIKWEDNSIEDDWGNSNPYSGFTFPTNMSDNEWEVIGNIYENKDLV